MGNIRALTVLKRGGYVIQQAWCSLLLFICFMVFANQAVAHEMWVLTSDQVLEWSKKPKPDIYTTMTLAGFVILLIAVTINLVLYQLNASGAREMFPMFRARMRSMRHHTSVVLRFCLGWVLISSALALEPRFGNAVLAEPTLLAPDLVVSMLPQSVQWLRWFELAIGVALIFGIYTRLAALSTILLAGFTIAFVGVPAIAYVPTFIGVAAYLFFSGPGAYYVPLPVPVIFKNFTLNLAHTVNLSRAQFLLRVLVGANFLYLAIVFKILQPNLAMAIVDIHGLPTMGFAPEVFVLILAAVEVTIGLLMVGGVLLRFLSVVIIGAFIFFSLCLPEAEYLTSHMLWYGVAVSFLINGSGRWGFKPASDYQAKILIIGNGLAAIAAARQLEGLLPDVSNVKVSLVSDSPDTQFKSMLPEIVSGTIQPTSVISPLVRALAKTEIILAETESIDFRKKCVVLRRPFGETELHRYDEIIYAEEAKPNRSLSTAENADGVFYLDSVADALRLKQYILKQASCVNSDAALHPQELGFAIVGGGQLGSTLAIEIRSLLNRLKVERQISHRFNPKIVIFEDESELESISPKLLDMRTRLFSNHEINVVSRHALDQIHPSGIMLQGSLLIKLSTVINLDYCANSVSFEKHASAGLPVINHDLSLAAPKYDGVWMVALRSSMPDQWSAQAIAQGSRAATNAWARSQGLATASFVPRQCKIVEFYMGQKTIATLSGMKLPSIVARIINRVKFLSLIPTLECKVRLVLDAILCTLFGKSTSSSSVDTRTLSNINAADDISALKDV